MARQASAFSYEKEYDTSFKLFYSRATIVEVAVKWMSKEMPDLIRKITMKTPKDPFRVLAVGTGDGVSHDDKLLDILSKLNMKVHYTVVEPRADAVDVFKNRVQYKYENTQFEWIPNTFENYQDGEQWINEKKFDLIHFVHSLYYFVSSFETMGARLRSCYEDMLKDGGAMVTVVSNQSQNYPQFEASTYYFNSPNVVGILARHEGWSCEHYNMDYQIDLTECFDDNSENGGYILDFLTRVVNFRQNAEKDQYNMTLNRLEKQCRLLSNGKKIVPGCNMDITVIWKN